MPTEPRDCPPQSRPLLVHGTRAAPPQPDAQKTVGIGPGIPFASKVLELTPEMQAVKLVPCARDMCHLHQWQRREDLYDDLIARAKAADQNGSQLAALLWRQGGADGFHIEDTENYRLKLVQFFEDLRNDLHPSLLIIMEIVRDSQLAVDMLNLMKIDHRGPPYMPDRTHVTPDGQVLVRELMAEVYLPRILTPRPPLSKAR
ncbi:probable carbohydrate esterase At4g34215 [Punica granatum]|uniref:Probable carbohydrate esterase At4g34215 n=1 Tax=Punica granatum TaxID=22663 RepID=A0A218X6X8_PUNGR|nr:probable carbohydrate esterase At4g34215 [Punica granatum]OWM80693.1 hypothetical protein CDL15_Pgr006723 [Punica granatum]